MHRMQTAHCLYIHACATVSIVFYLSRSPPSPLVLKHYRNSSHCHWSLCAAKSFLRASGALAAVLQRKYAIIMLRCVVCHDGWWLPSYAYVLPIDFLPICTRRAHKSNYIRNKLKIAKHNRPHLVHRASKRNNKKKRSDTPDTPQSHTNFVYDSVCYLNAFVVCAWLVSPLLFLCKMHRHTFW